MKVEFNTRRFEFSHGKQPRGFGYWSFCPTDKYSSDSYLSHCFGVACSSYGDAKKKAAAFFASKGIFDVTVCS